jgi:methylglutaconyl-CoA hydratase
MPSLIQIEPLAPGASAVVLHRAERRNALSIALLDELCAAIERLAADPAQRVIVLRGDGPVFSAGLDLAEARDDTLVERSAAAVARTLQLLRETSLVTIAAVHGGAYAGGAGLMAACDIVVAAEEAQIGFPEARRGLLPALISDVLRARVREGDLRHLLLTGETVSAAAAQRFGLVQRVVSADSLKDEARRLANLVLEGGPETIRRTKQLINGLYAPPAAAAHADMPALHLSARRGDEAREGLAAFLEKRSPWWKTEQSQ